MTTKDHVTLRVKATRWITVKGRIHGGLSVCLLPTELAKKAGLDPPQRQYKIRGEGGNKISAKGDMGVIEIEGRETPTVILVADIEEPLFGLEALRELGGDLDTARGELRAGADYKDLFKK